MDEKFLVTTMGKARIAVLFTEGINVCPCALSIQPCSIYWKEKV
jgi:hypothetical protein